MKISKLLSWILLQRKYYRSLSQLEFIERKEAELSALREEFSSLGLGKFVRLGDPTQNIGTALELVDHFGLILSRGTCFGDCVACLNKENWKNSISEIADVWDYCTWVEKPRGEVTYIDGYGRTVPIAVCRCLVSARRSGVI